MKEKLKVEVEVEVEVVQCAVCTERTPLKRPFDAEIGAYLRTGAPIPADVTGWVQVRPYYRDLLGVAAICPKCVQEPVLHAIRGEG